MENIYKQILEATSEEEQLNMMVEEMGELLQAISKYNRAKTKIEKDIVLLNLREEIGDVENMINQMKYMFDGVANGKSIIDFYKNQKLEQIKEKLKITIKE